MSIQCFWLEETVWARRHLRRYHSSPDRDCPVNGYHNAMIAIDEVPHGRKPWAHNATVIVADYFGADDSKLFVGDERWPTHCACGYAFADSDARKVFMTQIYRRTDTGEEMTDREFPAGAMYDAWWLKNRIDRRPIPMESA